MEPEQASMSAYRGLRGEDDTVSEFPGPVHQVFGTGEIEFVIPDVEHHFAHGRQLREELPVDDSLRTPADDIAILENIPFTRKMISESGFREIRYLNPSSVAG